MVDLKYELRMDSMTAVVERAILELADRSGTLNHSKTHHRD